MRFFEPSDEWFAWMKKFAGKRTVFDVGCGDGHILLGLHAVGVRAIGMDNRYKYEQMPIPLTSCVLAHDAENSTNLKNARKSIVMFCRPCHSGFVRDTIKQLSESNWVLYISMEHNFDRDVGGIDGFMQLSQPAYGQDGERMWLKMGPGGGRKNFTYCLAGEGA